METPETQGQPESDAALAPAHGSAADDASQEIEVLTVIKLPLPMNGFIGLLKGLKRDFGRDVFIRNSPEGYEIFRKRTAKAKPPNDKLTDRNAT